MSFLNSLNKQQGLRLLIMLMAKTITLPLYAAGYLFPKRNTIWIFGNYHGDKDNSFYLYQYIRRNDANICAIWISKHDKKINKKYSHAYYYMSIKGLYYQYIASVSIHTTGLGDFAKFCGAKKFRVQLWHGIPIKKILLDSPETLPFSNQKNIIARLLQNYARKQIKESYDLTIASSDYVQEIFMTAFNQKKENVVITGYPRQDIITNDIAVENKKVNVLYAPTWRSNNKQLIEIILRGIAAIKYHLSQKSYVITISLHPLNSSLYSQLEHIADIDFYKGQDINCDLGSFNMLVTDYSSIALDFLPLQKEFFFYTPDLKQYSMERGIYSNFLQLIKDRQISEIRPNSLVELERYFKFNDRKSCERITKTIKSRRNNTL